MGGLSKMAEEKHEIIKEAKEEVEEILSEAVIKEINEYKQTAIWERNSMKRCAREEGLKKGLREGRKKGMKQGIQQGIEEKTRKVVINMLQKEMNIEDIMELVEISKEEIQKIKEEMNHKK